MRDGEADERELDSVRLAFTMASRRACLPAPVDGVTAALDDEPRLAADAARSTAPGSETPQSGPSANKDSYSRRTPVE